MQETIKSREILDDLILDIEEEKCVLLIGPEICKVDGKSQIRFVHEAVMESESEHIGYYYSSDSLFYFKNASDKNRVARRIKRLYRNLEFPFEVYQRILELPMPLIISLNPDTFLTDSAQQLGLAHQFSHFRFTGEAIETVETPSLARPLIYNLCGCRSEEESMILDYEDLFKLLRAVLPDGLPDKIRLKLREANSFLFLGFDFEKWYTQLLMQLLTGERKGRPKFALRAKPENNAARDFLINQFQLRFLSEEQEFFDQLYQVLGEEGLLRKLNLPVQGTGKASTDEVKELIRASDYKEAFEKARNLPLQSDLFNDLLLLESRFNQWQEKENGGLFLPGESPGILNQIIRDFLDFLKRVQ